MARAFSRAVQEVQLEVRVGVSYFSDPRLGLVCAMVENQQDLEIFGGDALLLRERLEAGADERLLVAGRDDYGDL